MGPEEAPIGGPVVRLWRVSIEDANSGARDDTCTSIDQKPRERPTEIISCKTNKISGSTEVVGVAKLCGGFSG